VRSYISSTTAEAPSFQIESIRYLDVHPVMPDGSPPELKDSFDSLLTPVLLNAALAALKVHPQTTFNARIGVDCATRALDRMTLNNADKGQC
jgi:peptidyl-prolyl isomerase D